MAEIPFWFHDRPKWVSGISRHTTCADVLQSLLRAHAAKNAVHGVDTATGAPPPPPPPPSAAAVKQLVLVEQWRGVERPLSHQSKVLKLWQAWGEEQPQVRFVVKRITSSSSSSQIDGLQKRPQSQLSTSRRKARRRNSSRISSSADTLHPSALLTQRSARNVAYAPHGRGGGGGGGGGGGFGASASSATTATATATTTTSDIECLMRIILTQGETIHSQLKRLQEREGQIETIEEEVHASRTRTAGKDYLINAYLDQQNSSSCGSNLSSDEAHRRGAKKKQGKSSKSTERHLSSHHTPPERLSEMVEALLRVSEVNSRLEEAEERIGDLNCQMEEAGAASASSGRQKLLPHHPHVDLESTHRELSRLRRLNESVGLEIDSNRRLIVDMRSAFDERRALVSRLESDVEDVECEGRRLMDQLRQLEELLPGEMPAEDDDVVLLPPPIVDDDDEEEEELLKDILRFRLSSSQLYGSSAAPPPPPSNEEDEKKFLERLRKLRVKATGAVSGPSTLSRADDDEEEEDLFKGSDAARTSATGSPGSSSSGCGTGSEELNGGGRLAANSTPDLPPLPPGDFLPPPPPPHHQQNRAPAAMPGSSMMGAGGARFARQVLKSVDLSASGDLDSNSDTGLSSLHSSSDEGTYVLDTLV